MAAISITCYSCNVTTQRPRESARICPRCHAVDWTLRFGVTVRELIAKLQTLTLDARVTVLDYDGHFVDVDDIAQLASDDGVTVAITHDWRGVEYRKSISDINYPSR